MLVASYFDETAFGCLLVDQGLQSWVELDNSEDIDNTVVDNCSDSFPHSCSFHGQSVHRSKGSSQLFIINEQICQVFLKQQRMDRTFMFFDNKTKKGSKKFYQHTNHSRSNSSKHQPIKSARLKPQLQKPVITQKQMQIRQAIQYRFTKSKMNGYQYNNTLTQRVSTRKSSHSSEMQEYKGMKNLRMINLKEFHEKKQLKNTSKNTSKDSRNLSKDAKNKYTMKFKLKQNRSTVFRTEASQPVSREKSKYFSKYLDRTLSQLSKKRQQEWKYISIQVKDQQKIKRRKEEVQINSHRTIQVEKNHSKTKTKNIDKYWQKVPKLKQLHKLNKKIKL